jgi:hypothetical protein
MLMAPQLTELRGSVTGSVTSSVGPFSLEMDLDKVIDVSRRGS